jgi:hypothetical protein
MTLLLAGVIQMTRLLVGVIQMTLLLVVVIRFQLGYAYVGDGTHGYVAGNASLLVDGNADGFK